MTPNDLPKALSHFVATYFQSVEQVEVLLQLFANRERTWSPEEVDQRVRSSPASIEGRLKRLADQKLIERDKARPSSYRYRPATSELDASVALLAAEYKVRRSRVIEAIYQAPTQKMMNLRDAFKLTKKDDDDE